MTSQAVIEQIRVHLAAGVPPRSRVMLFGSRARGDGDDGSHFDVRHRAAGCDRATESVRLRRVLRGLGVPIGIVVIDEERARRRAAVRGTMVQRALHEGRLLVDA